MDERFERTELLIGKENLLKLKNSRVLIFGIGGVGSYIAEALARGGVGKFTLVDRDTVSLSNINRQIIALDSTLGRYKTSVMAERIMQINPEAQVECKNIFYGAEKEDEIDFSLFDYVADAVDTVSAKLLIIKKAKESGVPVISSMGTGNKLCPEKFRIADISKTEVCPLARVMRRELRKMGIDRVKVLFSTEETVQRGEPLLDEETKKQIQGSISFVPPTAGLMIAGEIIKDIMER